MIHTLSLHRKRDEFDDVKSANHPKVGDYVKTQKKKTKMATMIPVVGSPGWYQYIGTDPYPEIITFVHLQSDIMVVDYGEGVDLRYDVIYPGGFHFYCDNLTIFQD